MFPIFTAPLLEVDGMDAIENMNTDNAGYIQERSPHTLFHAFHIRSTTQWDGEYLIKLLRENK